jgi:hypothetical protein
MAVCMAERKIAVGAAPMSLKDLDNANNAGHGWDDRPPRHRHQIGATRREREMTQPTAYPLQWPSGWPRTNAMSRQRWPNQVTLGAALKELESEMRMLGVKQIVLSSNCSLGMENAPDPGVVAYGFYDQQQIAVPCDRWSTVAANVRAIAKTINAMRGMERWGAKHMIKAMFQGFTAIRGPGPKPWREIIGIPPEVRPTIDIVRSRQRELARIHHPDVGGDPERMAEINAAVDVALRELAA